MDPQTARADSMSAHRFCSWETRVDLSFTPHDLVKTSQDNASRSIDSRASQDGFASSSVRMRRTASSAACAISAERVIEIG